MYGNANWIRENLDRPLEDRCFPNLPVAVLVLGSLRVVVKRLR